MCANGLLCILFSCIAAALPTTVKELNWKIDNDTIYTNAELRSLFESGIQPSSIDPHGIKLKAATTTLIIEHFTFEASEDLDACHHIRLLKEFGAKFNNHDLRVAVGTGDLVKARCVAYVGLDDHKSLRGTSYNGLFRAAMKVTPKQKAMEMLNFLTGELGVIAHIEEGEAMLETGDEDFVKYYVDHGGVIGKKAMFIFSYAHSQISWFLLAAKYGWYKLINGPWAKSDSIVARVITPDSAHLPVLRFLLEKGANPNGVRMARPLDYAAAQTDAEKRFLAILLLLKAGADPNLCSRARTLEMCSMVADVLGVHLGMRAAEHQNDSLLGMIPRDVQIIVLKYLTVLPDRPRIRDTASLNKRIMEGPVVSVEELRAALHAGVRPSIPAYPTIRDLDKASKKEVFYRKHSELSSTNSQNVCCSNLKYADCESLVAGSDGQEQSTVFAMIISDHYEDPEYYELLKEYGTKISAFELVSAIKSGNLAKIRALALHGIGTPHDLILNTSGEFKAIHVISLLFAMWNKLGSNNMAILSFMVDEWRFPIHRSFLAPALMNSRNDEGLVAFMVAHGIHFEADLLDRLIQPDGNKTWLWLLLAAKYDAAYILQSAWSRRNSLLAHVVAVDTIFHQVSFQLLTMGANPNGIHGQRPLSFALMQPTQQGRVAALCFLLANGARLDMIPCEQENLIRTIVPAQYIPVTPQNLGG